MFAKPSSSIRALAALAGVGLLSGAAGAGSIDDAAGRVVVPFVTQEKDLETRVFVTNHESFPVRVAVKYAGMQYGPAPGLKNCPNLTLPGGQMTTIDVPTYCGLPANAGPGMLVLLEGDPGLASISARARTDVVSPMSGNVLQTLAIGGLPLPALDTTENVHVVTGLRQNAPGATPTLTTDCYFGLTIDGSQTGGILGNLTLYDSNGGQLGSPTYFSAPQYTLAQMKDVFTLVGAPPGPHEGVRAEFTITGRGDAVVGYCATSQAGALKNERTIAYDLAQVAQPQDEVRRRQFSVNTTPRMAAFMLQPTQTRVVHGIYVRHPDLVKCTVSSFDPLVLTATSPDGAQVIGGVSSTTPEFGNSVHASVNGGVDDLWGLEVSWPPGTHTSVAPYTISCTSGNGVSLADVLFAR